MSDAGPDDGAQPPGDPPADDTEGRQRWIIIGLVVALVVLLAAVGLYLVLDDDDSETASTTTSTSTTATATTIPAPTGTPDSSAPPAPPVAAPCGAGVLLDAIGGSVQGTAVIVDDFRCTAADGGYAWALVVPADPTLIADPLGIYLQDVGGAWQVLDFGTGISCADAGAPPGACADLP
jgi:hypothetical protein